MAGPSVAVRILGDLTGWTQSVAGAADDGETGAGRIKSAFSSVLGTLNKTGIFGPFQSQIDAVGTALDGLTKKGATTGEKLMAAGGGVLGLGLGLQTIASGQQAAQQQLSTAIDNTGGSWEQYSTSIAEAVKAEEKHGETATETYTALQSLTQATHDPAEAIKLLGEASDLAAAKHEDLSTAADQLGKSYNGNTRLFKQFGITVSTVVATQAQLKSATTGATNADQRLADAREHLTALESSGKASASQLMDAHQKVADAVLKSKEAHDKLSAAQYSSSHAGSIAADNMTKLAGVINGQANAASDTFKGKLNALKATLETQVSTLAQKYGPGVTAAGIAITGFGTALELAKGAHEALEGAQIAEKVATAAGAVVTGIATAAQWAFNAAMDANPVMLVVLAIAALVAAFVLAYTHVTWFRDGINDLWQFIQSAWDGIVAIFQSVVDWLSQNWPLILGILTGPFGLMVAAIATHWTEVLDGIKKIPGLIVDVFKGAGEWLKEAGADVVSGLLVGIDKIWKDVKTFFEGIGSYVLGIFTGALSWLSEAGQDVISGLLSGINKIWTDVTTFFGNVPGAIVGIFKDADQWLVNAGKDVLKGLATGLVTAAKDTVGHIPIIGSKLVKEFENALGVHSPSTIFAAIGADVVAGFVNGINGAASSATSAVGTMAAGVAASASGSSASGSSAVPLVNMENVTIASGVDVDLLAQKVSAALVAGRV